MSIDKLGSIALRSITESDSEFLQSLYVTTRWDELDQVSWTDLEKKQFLHSQFKLQQQHYQTHYSQSIRSIIQYCNGDIGRIDLFSTETEVRLIDMALMPLYRHQGIGANLIRHIQRQASEVNKVVTLSVINFNPAIKLYQRLDFKKTDENGLYWHMKWIPPTGAPQFVQ